jgi:hypothetical protein
MWFAEQIKTSDKSDLIFVVEGTTTITTVDILLTLYTDLSGDSVVEFSKMVQPKQLENIQNEDILSKYGDKAQKIVNKLNNKSSLDLISYMKSKHK